MFLYLFRLTAALALLVTASAATSAEPERPVVHVATSECPPFSMSEGGKHSGLSIFLWEEIARRLDVDYEFQAHTLKSMLDAVAQGEAHLGVACISITAERERLLDFSHSYFETHLAIAVKQQGYLSAVGKFFSSSKVLTAIGIVLSAAALIGGVLYVLEHNVNPKLYSMKTSGGRMVEALIIGLLFVTRGPIRYYEFKTFTARMLSALLAVGSTLLIASVTAVLASAFTLEHLRSEITGPQDLKGSRVGAMEASTASRYLENNGITFRPFSVREEMMDALDSGALDAVVSDAATLQYTIKKAREGGQYETLSVLPYQFEKQNYGFAMVDDSPHIETLNQALLAVRKSPVWKRALTSFLGTP